MTIEELWQALDLLDQRVLRVRPLYPNCWKSHHTTVTCPYQSAWHDIQRTLAHALDTWADQTGMPILEALDDVRAVLVRVADAHAALLHAQWMESLAQAIEMLDDGAISVRPFNPARDERQYGKQLHTHVCASDAEAGMANDDARYPWMVWMKDVLDDAQQRTGAFCQTTAEARAVLVQLLEEQTNEQTV